MKIYEKTILWVTCLISIISCSKTKNQTVSTAGLERIQMEIPNFGKTYYFPFYGREIAVNIEEDILAMHQTLRVKKRDSLHKDITRLIMDLRNQDFDKTIQMLLEQSDSMNLDDFGYRLLLQKFTQQIFSGQSKKFREIIVWYGLRSNDLGAMLFANKTNIVCFFQSDEDFIKQRNDSILYYPSFEVQNLTYWNKKELPEGTVVDKIDSEIFPTKQHRSLKFENHNLPLLGKRIQTKKRSFVFKERRYSLRLRYNKHIVKYLDDLPMRTMSRHLLELPLSKESEKEFRDSIPMWLADKTDYQKIAFLIDFINKAFPYKKDDSEKFNFVEQTLYSEYTDCDDKGILFCYLAKEFMGADVLLLEGPVTKREGHACGAIKITQNNTLDQLNNEGNIFYFNGEKYLVCDQAGGELGRTVFSKKALLTTVQGY